MPPSTSPNDPGRSLLSKFVRMMLLMSGIIGVCTLGIVVLTSAQSATDELATVQGHIRDGITSKGTVLTRNHALALRSLIADNAFLDIRRLVARTVTEDPDVVYGICVGIDGRTLAFARGDAPSPLVNEDASSLLGLAPRDAVATTESVRRGAILGQDVLEVAVPIVGDDGILGSIRYGLSTRRMQVAIDQAKADSRARMKRSVLMVGTVVVVTTFFGLLLSRLNAARITKPLQNLTVSANAIATRTRHVRREADSCDDLGALDVSLVDGNDDEIGQLVRSFSAMATSIRERDSMIQMQVSSLENARDELESRVATRTEELHRAKSLAESVATSLHDSEVRMRSIVEYAADAIITLGATGVIEVFNPAAAAIFGYAPEAVVGKPFSALLPDCYSIDLARLSVASTESGARVEIGRSGEIRGLMKDGGSFPLQFSLSEVKLEVRSLYTAIVRDISERKRAESERQALNERLVAASRQVGMAEVASDVLHNVGNVLNSVNTSAGIVGATIRRSTFAGLGKATALLRQHEGDLGTYLTEDKRGKLLPAYLEKLAQTVADEHVSVLAELESLTKDIELIKSIVTMQQSYARPSVDMRESLALPELVEDALRITQASLARHEVVVVRDFEPTPAVMVDRTKVVHLLVNLVNNAKQAMETAPIEGERRELRLRIRSTPTHVRVEVTDNGIGIPKENLVRIFNHGFTTRKDGHGFGLHSGALSATAMGGSLSAESEGAGHGATFVLLLPVEAPLN